MSNKKGPYISTESIIGTKKDRLTLVRFSRKINRWEYVICICDCGKEVELKKHSFLRAERGRGSCGCRSADAAKLSHKRRHENKVLESGLGPDVFTKAFRARLMRVEMNIRSVNKSKPGILERVDVVNLLRHPCAYCGFESLDKMGIDRVDSKMGYLKDNVVSCCKPCNRAKSDLGLEDFKDWLKRCYNRTILGI